MTHHEFGVMDFQKTLHSITMKIAVIGVEIVWIGDDMIWNHAYDDYYISSWGSYAPPAEIIGKNLPYVFPGLASFWYVKLRLR